MELIGALNLKIKHCRGSQKVSESTDEDIINEVFKICHMVGIRQSQMPTDGEMEFLIHWIRSNYSHHGLTELALAFELGLQDRLDVSDMKSYGNFSIQYLSEIMNSYHRLLDFIRKNQNPKPQEMKALPAPVLTLEDKRKEVEEFAATNKLHLHILPLYIYDYLEELGLIPDTLQDRERRKEKAIQARLNQIFYEASSGSKDAREELRSFKKDLDNGKLTDQQKALLERITKRIAIFEYLTQYHDTIKKPNPRPQKSQTKSPQGSKH
jgi:hypothetical protein